GEPRLAAMQDCIASQVFLAASTGATHASRGWPWMATQGLRASRDCVAQWIHGGPENTYLIQPW
ncbi:MAG: hypothetical protein ACLP2F_16605, partial [Steroidobacteraceae bacterium]